MALLRIDTPSSPITSTSFADHESNCSIMMRCLSPSSRQITSDSRQISSMNSLHRHPISSSLPPSPTTPTMMKFSSSPSQPRLTANHGNRVTCSPHAQLVEGKVKRNSDKEDVDEFEQELLIRLINDPLRHHYQLPPQELSRIADQLLIRTQEFDEALQDIIYTMVLLKLAHYMMDHHNGNDCLRNIHPLDVRPFLDRHVAMVINGKQHNNEAFNPNEYTKIHKYDLGKIYAASIMQGYFLARVHQRFKLEKQLQQDTLSMDAYADKHSKSLYPLSRIHCGQIVNVIEHHVESIIDNTFVDMYKCKSADTKGSNRCNEIFDIQYSCIENLILHALAFGTTLWDIECNLIPSS